MRGSFMELNEYQKVALRTAAQFDGPSIRLLCYALSLNGEVGEIANLIGGHVFRCQTLNKDQLKLDLGDALWYITALAACCGFSLEDVASANVEKLKTKYPNGFSFIEK
jgi:NTP pyrophosphatase (non-canonical NTP hydrolase)